MSSSRILRRLAIGVVAIAAVPALAGCWQGQGASTTMQATMNSGNGTQAMLGAMRIENATVVRGDDGTASLIMSVFNQGAEPDTLTSVTINGAPASIAPTAIVPGTFQAFGYGVEGQPPTNVALVTGLDVEASSYVPVTLTFERAGLLDISVLTVPPVGYYEGLLPVTG
ncbi:MAG: hypothetical protein KGN38_00430 [Actinomycetales bacterium]|nr:hypothetical protein [Actinomycetales bacterium]